MDNENKMNEGFDEIVPASSEKQDNEMENTLSSEAQECTNDAAEAQEPAEAEPAIPHHTVGTDICQQVITVIKADGSPKLFI